VLGRSPRIPDCKALFDAARSTTSGLGIAEQRTAIEVHMVVATASGVDVDIDAAKLLELLKLGGEVASGIASEVNQTTVVVSFAQAIGIEQEKFILMTAITIFVGGMRFARGKFNQFMDWWRGPPPVIAPVAPVREAMTQSQTSYIEGNGRFKLLGENAHGVWRLGQRQ